MEHEISLAAEKLGQIGPLVITNTLIFSWIVVIALCVFAYLAGRNAKLVPNGIQNVAEAVLEPVYNLTRDLAHEKAKVFFPYVMTFFLYIMVANWFGLLPGVGTIFINRTVPMHEEVSIQQPDSGQARMTTTEKVPLIRPVNTDLNMTLGLGLLSIFLTHLFAIKYLGVGGYLGKWFSFNIIFLFVGLLELVGEVTKILSLSLRLFGNIFAGEVVLTTVAGIAPFTAFVIPLPFYFLEIIVGVVQAAVFMMLTLVFMVLLAEKHEAH